MVIGLVNLKRIRTLNPVIIAISLFVLMTTQPVFASTSLNVESRVEDAIKSRKSVISEAIDTRLDALGASNGNGSGRVDGDRALATETSVADVSPSDPIGPWSSWHSLEGAIRSNSDPVTTYNPFSDNFLPITFVIGTDNALYFRMQQDASDPASWTPWKKIGGVVRTNSDPAVIFTAGSVVHVFVIGTDNAVWYTRQTGIDTFSAFQSLGGTVDPNTSPAVERDHSSARLHLFVVGTDNALWHRSQAPGSDTWLNWESFGGALRDNTSPAVARNSDGRLQVFVVGTPNGLYSKSQQTPGNSFWTTSYQSLGGQVDSNTSPAAVWVISGGRMEVFVLGTNNALWHIRQTESNSNTWSSWLSLGGGLRDNSDPDVIVNFDGRLQAFVVSSDNRVFYTWQISTGALTNWSPYEVIGGGTVRINTSPDLGCNEQNTFSTSLCEMFTHVFVAGNDGALWYSWRTISP
jgi:hypothetical protein